MRALRRIFYWAPTQASNVEVDFLLQRGRRFLAIEVKSQARYSTSMLSGLRAVSDLPKLARHLAPRRHAKLEDEYGIEVWPLQRFLDTLEADNIWP